MTRKDKRNPYEAERIEPFTNKEMEAMCDVTAMTLHLWRQGPPAKTGPLETVPGLGRAVLFPVKKTLRWLRDNGVPVYVHPDDLRKPRPAQGQAAVKKPGPKPRATAHALAHSERPMAW